METDPLHLGWRCHLLKFDKGPRTWLMGQRGIVGCASIRYLGDDLDVALYLEKPEEVAKGLKENEPYDAVYKRVKQYPGCGLEIIRLIEEDRKS